METNRIIEDLQNALKEIKQRSPDSSDGKWLERVTVSVAPLIADWDCKNAWGWYDWPDRKGPEVGVDVVAERNGGGLIAIQCKSRQIVNGEGAKVAKKELNSFVAAASGRESPYDELWLVVNGSVGVHSNAESTMQHHQITHINLRAEIENQLLEQCQDIDEPTTPSVISRNEMQDEAVKTVCYRLRENAEATGRSRGRIILPCGTGKSRIALRVIEELTEPGKVSAILCPSIALVAQLRREFLLHGERIVALAVCSDQTAARGNDLSKDQTADLSQTSARDVKGRVETKPEAISNWIQNVPKDQVGVIFGTYQSSHKIGEALIESRHELACIVADEAHRTAGIKKVGSQEQKLRDFTVCHDDTRFPAKYRVYQTATPKVFKTPQQYKADKRLTKQGKWVVKSMDDENVFGPELYRRNYEEAVKNGWLSDYRIIALGVNDQEAYNTANELASKEGSALSAVLVIRGLALAMVMGGAAAESTGPIKSSISFLNTIKKSKEMTDVLQSQASRKFVAERLGELGIKAAEGGGGGG
ncbi:MAG: DEAD/DEAH box helicase family protein [Gammaproteobacteria bacterium]|nr:DEAD/DEAH box helicase family protein [Gammaproteobacteria bacterium]